MTQAQNTTRKQSRHVREKKQLRSQGGKKTADFYCGTGCGSGCNYGCGCGTSGCSPCYAYIKQ